MLTRKRFIASLVFCCAAFTAGAAHAQVAGSSTTLGVTTTEVTQVALGWSAKKNLLGKTVYNDSGDKVGSVQDLIIAPDKNVSYIIIGTGGFIGLGRHDVAIPVAQVSEQNGRLVMPRATKDLLKAMPEFEYASDNTRRDQFVANAEQDISRAKARIAELKQSAASAKDDARHKLDVQIGTLQNDVAAAEDKLAEMKRAGTARWRSFEGDMNLATTRLRRSLASNPPSGS